MEAQGVMSSSPTEEAGSNMGTGEGWWELVKDMEPVNSWCCQDGLHPEEPSLPTY